MTTLKPTAPRKRLEELLEYLGKTENYSKYYNGNRAEDFKKCFDIESRGAGSMLTSCSVGWRRGSSDIPKAKVLHPRSCECLFNHCSR